MVDNRKETRYGTVATVCISGVFEGDALLKDISITGCCIEITAPVNLQPDTGYIAKIIPETIAKVEPFELQVESRWVKMRGGCTEAGFVINASPTGKHFSDYVDYLAWRASATN
jgi:hypothetical protein